MPKSFLGNKAKPKIKQYLSNMVYSQIIESKCHTGLVKKGAQSYYFCLMSMNKEIIKFL